MIAYDETQRSIVAICDCGAREILWSSQAAYEWSAAHLAVCSLVGQAERERTLAAVRAGRHRYR